MGLDLPALSQGMRRTMALSTLCRFTTGRRILIMAVASALALTASSVTSGPAPAKAPGRARTAEPSTLSDKAKFYDSRKDPAPARGLRGRAAQLSARPRGGGGGAPAGGGGRGGGP